jgi:hypothetical protein
MAPVPIAAPHLASPLPASAFPQLALILLIADGHRQAFEWFGEVQILRKPCDEDGLMKAILAALS